jgi:hypothetical protein
LVALVTGYWCLGAREPVLRGLVLPHHRHRYGAGRVPIFNVLYFLLGANASGPNRKGRRIEMVLREQSALFLAYITLIGVPAKHLLSVG